MSKQEKKYSQIIENYPRLYKECKYIACNIGWYDLIDELSYKLEKIIDKYKYEEDCCFMASQVKEKYGTLHFYMLGATDEMLDVINQYEDQSTYTCETCGKPGKLQEHNHWYYTSCEEHTK